jgi:hypothetical protein
MPKRYHQSKMDRKRESEGMKTYLREKRDGESSYSRYMREMNESMRSFDHGRDDHNDSRMHSKENEYTMRHNTGGYLTEDHNQVANLPQNVIYRPYGDPVPYLPQEIDDTITGIDRQRGYDMKKAMQHLYPKKV